MKRVTLLLRLPTSSARRDRPASMLVLLDPRDVPNQSSVRLRRRMTRNLGQSHVSRRINRLQSRSRRVPSRWNTAPSRARQTRRQRRRKTNLSLKVPTRSKRRRRKRSPRRRLPLRKIRLHLLRPRPHRRTPPLEAKRSSSNNSPFTSIRSRNRLKSRIRCLLRFQRVNSTN